MYIFNQLFGCVLLILSVHIHWWEILFYGTNANRNGLKVQIIQKMKILSLSVHSNGQSSEAHKIFLELHGKRLLQHPTEEGVFYTTLNIKDCGVNLVLTNSQIENVVYSLVRAQISTAASKIKCGQLYPTVSTRLSVQTAWRFTQQEESWQVIGSYILTPNLSLEASKQCAKSSETWIAQSYLILAILLFVFGDIYNKSCFALCCKSPCCEAPQIFCGPTSLTFRRHRFQSIMTEFSFWLWCAPLIQATQNLGGERHCVVKRLQAVNSMC